VMSLESQEEHPEAENFQPHPTNIIKKTNSILKKRQLR
jgi:hypothetical protein